MLKWKWTDKLSNRLSNFCGFKVVFMSEQFEFMSWHKVSYIIFQYQASNAISELAPPCDGTLHVPGRVPLHVLLHGDVRWGHDPVHGQLRGGRGHGDLQQRLLRWSWQSKIQKCHWLQELSKKLHTCKTPVQVRKGPFTFDWFQEKDKIMENLNFSSKNLTINSIVWLFIFLLIFEKNAYLLKVVLRVNILRLKLVRIFLKIFFKLIFHISGNILN